MQYHLEITLVELILITTNLPACARFTREGGVCKRTREKKRKQEQEYVWIWG